MSDDALTIVIPTRDRTDLLELSLRSVFKNQDSVPPVIVSDNSTREHPEMETLQQRYPFEYVRQNGELSATGHHNACLKLAASRWVWLLHDDDEIAPGAIAAVESLVRDYDDVGIVVGGVEDIDINGGVKRCWKPPSRGVVHGEDALLALGLDWGARAPCTVFRVALCRQNGGYRDAGGLPCDYAFAVLMAYEHGVGFCDRVIGRFRVGHQRASVFETQQGAESWVRFLAKQVELVSDSGCSRSTAERIADYMIWFSFRPLLSSWLKHPTFAIRLTRLCLRKSPKRGEWQGQVRKEFPFLFWRPDWLAWPLYRVLRVPRRLWQIARRAAVPQV